MGVMTAIAIGSVVGSMVSSNIQSKRAAKTNERAIEAQSNAEAEALRAQEAQAAAALAFNRERQDAYEQQYAEWLAAVTPQYEAQAQAQANLLNMLGGTGGGGGGPRPELRSVGAGAVPSGGGAAVPVAAAAMPAGAAAGPPPAQQAQPSANLQAMYRAPQGGSYTQHMMPTISGGPSTMDVLKTVIPAANAANMGNRVTIGEDVGMPPPVRA